MKKKVATVTIGLIQYAMNKRMDEDRELAREHAETLIKTSVAKGAQIICLPELCLTTYFPQYRKNKKSNDFSSFAETIPGKTTEYFSKLAKELGVVLIVPLFEVKNQKYYNTAVVIDADGTLLGVYRKTHIPYDPLFWEKDYFEESKDGFKVFQTKFAKVSPLICYDQWFPEAARSVALLGTEIIFYPTAIGRFNDDYYGSAQENKGDKEGDWKDAWTTIQRSHAIANHVHVASINRVGTEDKLTFFGGSFVCDAFGNIIEQAGDNEDILIVTVNLAMNKEVKEKWMLMQNRRPDMYNKLVEENELVKKLYSNNNIKHILNKTKREHNYYMPAEWTKHSAIWLSWPHNNITFPNLGHVEKTYVQIIKEIHVSENVNLFVIDDNMKNKVKKLLNNAEVDMSKIEFFIYDYADVWFRDYGPIFLKERNIGKLAMTNWIFNAWGNKYPNLKKDTRIPLLINETLQLNCFNQDFVLEGGSIDVNGKGTLLTTEQCLLNKNRNPQLSKQEIEDQLKEILGVRHIIWLKEGIVGDDTDGHIDDIARFVNENTIVCCYEDNNHDENFQSLKENYHLLVKAVDQDGKKMNIIKLPMPDPVYYTKKNNDKFRLPASYANFYIGNTVVLVPVFGCEKDKIALDILKKLFPERKIVGINCAILVQGLGTLHCISQQMPEKGHNPKNE